MQTSSFSVYQGPGRISIARFAPRGTPPGFRIYKTLAPGPWFNEVSEAVYRDLYSKQLGTLDAHKVWDELHAIANGSEPILLCWEHPHDLACGKTYCHRRMVADWIVDRLGIDVPELALERQAETAPLF